MVFARNRRIYSSVQNSDYGRSGITLVLLNISINVLGNTPVDKIKLHSNAGKYNSVKNFPVLHHTSTGNFLEGDN
jgi:hypothetical protein